MNQNLIDKKWKAYAELNKLPLECKDQNIFHGVKSEYLITISSGNPIIILKGMLNKNSQGHNGYKTKIIITESTAFKYSFKEVTDKRLFGLIKNNYKDQIQQSFLLMIRKYEARRLTIEENEIMVEFDYIFKSDNDFEKVKNITDEIKKIITQQNQHND